MAKKATHRQYNGIEGILYLGFELGKKFWKLGFSTGLGQQARIRNIDGGDLAALKREISMAKKKFGLSANSKVMSCYEAGRDGFWLARWLEAEGIANWVMDSSSIEVNRRRKRAKTDRLDANSLVRLLMRSMNGEDKVFSVVRVPTVEDEDRRQLQRHLSTLTKEKTRVRNRITSLLYCEGIRFSGKLELLDQQLESIRLWDQNPLPEVLKARLRADWALLLFIKEQISTLQAKRDKAIREQAREPQKDSHLEKTAQLAALKGIANTGACTLVGEVFGWRKFNNRRQVGSLTGLTPTPYQSGNSYREQGISKAGIRRVRQIAIELAWSWVRNQSGSKLTLWYNERFATAGKRTRKIGIVALARRLMIELWKYLETGVIPEGAELKATA